MSACPVKFGATLPFTGRGIHVLFYCRGFFCLVGTGKVSQFWALIIDLPATR